MLRQIIGCAPGSEYSPVSAELLAVLAAVVVVDDRSEPVRRADSTAQEDAARERADGPQTDGIEEPIDFVRARELFRRRQHGEKLTADEEAYLQKAIETRRRRAGTYLWADGVTARKDDGLVWNGDDLGGDGTHPSPSGRDKVARMLLKFFTEDPLAKPWFARSSTAKE